MSTRFRDNDQYIELQVKTIDKATKTLPLYIAPIHPFSQWFVVSTETPEVHSHPHLNHVWNLSQCCHHSMNRCLLQSHRHLNNVKQQKNTISS